ncbi:SEC-C domain-containing protein [Alicyclobacillus hesperidum]
MERSNTISIYSIRKIVLATMNVKRTAPCPCGSPLAAKDCCYPTKSQVNMPIPQYITLEPVPPYRVSVSPPIPPSGKALQDQIVENLRKSIQFTVLHGAESGPGILPREHANLQICKVLGYEQAGYYLEAVRNEHQLIIPLHTAKYHQQQCMYRLFMLEQKSNKGKRSRMEKPDTKGHLARIIEYDDLPLRAEFEAFVSQVASSLDALAQYTCKCLGKSVNDLGSHFKLANYLKAQHDVEWLHVLSQKYTEYEDWARIVMRQFRDFVIHEGTVWTLDAGKDISVSQPFSAPSWQGKSIEVLCVENWRTLMQFVGEVRSILLDYRLTS